ncbi:MAG: ABC transporter ATP-binding protein [Armatimonadota bacterium]|nr:ABC transporter ATP-binding protein [Armatimonadota bacterium]MDR7402714.1 ABC transporter ATP-binding protein [Armatimonadota bacterium]MDR7403511.1 ABC transporter ATP-binding protein [Armatimonadota bacterium]MDR7506490.1 ABC transporter ATP-binding protein [Armatimonadota bacterium]MDR7509855.1 ABC transporter ATP-binding protein [Armatimonadota bacterium]
MADPLIRTEHLTKRYGTFVAVRDLDLQVEPGEIFGFLGPNGAGKTTTLLMLLGILQPTNGQIFLWGRPLEQDLLKVRQRIGVVGEHDYIPDHLTAEEYLFLFAKLYNVPRPRVRIDALLERLGLSEFRALQARDYSRGMKQKLCLARALLHNPQLLILDEPASGLDPHGIVQVRRLLLDLNQDGVTILISSHLLSEVERTAHRVGILHRGRLIRQDSIANITAQLATEQTVEVELQTIPPHLDAILADLPAIRRIRTTGNRVAITVAGGTDQRGAISQAVTAAGGVILGLRVVRPTLEEAFLTLTEEAVASWAS